MAVAARRRGRESPAERYLPIIYLLVFGLIVMVVLPSALRPPNQQPNQTAELSPDAPPDKNQTAIISSLNRASSGVATSPNEQTTQANGQPVGAPTAPPPPRACPDGVGNPPRQVESLFAPPCAP